MKDFIFRPAWDGLGDHLFYTHLPRIAAQSGRYRRVLMSKDATFRSKIYRALFWEQNPYLNDFTDQQPRKATVTHVNPGTNILDQIMLSHGLDDGERFHEPEVYFDVPRKPEFCNATVYDPNYLSYVGNLRTIDIVRFFEMGRCVPDVMLQPRRTNASALRFGATCTTSSFMQYCSLIVSARKFICLTSGGATLASALGRPAIALWAEGQNPMFHHSPLHTYINVRPSFGMRWCPAVASVIVRELSGIKSHIRRVMWA